MDSQRLRVLLSAYACEPGAGSEPGVGWNWARQVSRSHEVWVLTRANNRLAIESALAEDPIDGAHFVYFDLPRWLRFWKKGQSGVRLYYYLWQVGSYCVARRLHRELNFHVVHHVTFVKYWMPSFLYLLPVPFLWGPVGGGESMPRSFRGSLSLRGKLYETLRDAARVICEHDPFVRATARGASLALVTTSATESRLRTLGCGEVRIFSEAGLGKEEIDALSSLGSRSGPKVRFMSSGNLLHLKGFELSLRAFAKVVEAGLPVEYWFVGEGPERLRLQSVAESLGITDRVVFWGRVPRADALNKLAECDVLVHPSLHDSGGWVCLEAMAAGRPVICLDLGGPGYQVTEESGIKIPAIKPDQAIRDLAAAMKRMAEDDELRIHLAEGGLRRVRRDFAWHKKAAFISQAYLQMIRPAGTA